MLRSSPATRRILTALASRHRFSTSAASTPPPPPIPTLPPRPPEFDVNTHRRRTTPHESDPNAHRQSTTPPESDPSAHRQSTTPQGERERERRGSSKYEVEQAKVLGAALSHVVRLGWSETAMIFGSRDVGVSPSIVGSFPRKEAALVEFFMDDCLQKLIDRIDSGEELQNLILSERLSKLICIRLEMQVPYLSKWPQALSIQARPMNLPMSFKQRAELVDEIWHAAGEQGSDIDWYVKQTVLGGIYSMSEVYMLTDHSPEFRDTWMFLECRIKDAFDLQKSVQEAAYLAEAVGAGMGYSVQGFMKRIFQRRIFPAV